MTEVTPKAVNGEGVRGLLAHISDMQTIAMKAHAVLEVVTHLDNEGTCNDGRILLAEYAEQLTDQLSIGLDIVNLPDAKGAHHG